MKLAAVAMVALLAASSAFSDDALDMRLKSLENELRCLVCQNQTLADSNAPLAEDLRREVRDLATGGKTDAEIRAYLVARYGDFVLYKPPIKSTTYVLWFGPFLLLAGGAVAWWVLIRRRSRASADAQTPAGASTSGADAVARARALLDD
jgi:cytochrome c-type biogenesis protein CcmH